MSHIEHDRCLGVPPRKSLGAGLFAVAVLRCAASHRAAGSARSSPPPRSVRCSHIATPGRRCHPSREMLPSHFP